MKKSEKKKKPVTKLKTEKPKESKQVGPGTYVLDASKEISTKENSTVLYTMLGFQDKLVGGFPVVEKVALGFAKQETRNNVTNYYIKSDDVGSLFNPLSQNINISFKSRVMAENDMNNLLKVSKDCFTHYLEFLKTKNILHYKFAERARF